MDLAEAEQAPSGGVSQWEVENLVETITPVYQQLCVKQMSPAPFVWCFFN